VFCFQFGAKFWVLLFFDWWKFSQADKELWFQYGYIWIYAFSWPNHFFPKMIQQQYCPFRDKNGQYEFTGNGLTGLFFFIYSILVSVVESSFTRPGFFLTKQCLFGHDQWTQNISCFVMCWIWQSVKMQPKMSIFENDAIASKVFLRDLIEPIENSCLG